ncbi:BA14K family protein [Chelativorans salis]|uniref:Lectin-like protein BA14k n=1 Tax=Chelativorans salis TaxID=2978478 RepID=A0ABT2LJP8_9HYPH|nr:BA14K family protein [Chelativorans sp. EGI FJ00035]MCT7374827.1 BA14K family protein [Chelativorans sp. EGI FJ00035]
MKRILKTSVLTLAVAATALATVPANADHWRHGGYGDYSRYERHGWHERHYVRKKKGSDGDLVAAGVLGLAVGAIAAGVLTQPRQPSRVYIDPPAPQPTYRYERNYYRTAPTYRSTASYSPEPWSREWYRACDARYRSFDPQSGTFMGYDGQRHFCVIR